jgi:alcohol dehydrogenase
MFVLTPMPAAHFGAGAVGELPGLVRGTGSSAAVIVTDPALAGSPVVARVRDVLAADGVTAAVFAGVRPNASTDDVAAGAGAVAGLPAEAGRVAEAGVAGNPERGGGARLGGGGRPGGEGLPVGGGGGGRRSAIDAAKGIALAAVNPQRGRGLDYHRDFARPALPIVAVPTTAGTGAETNAFAVVTNPWSDGIALQVIRMIASYLPRAVADGGDREARSQMLLAAHLAGVGMASTGLGICHAIGHSLGRAVRRRSWGGTDHGAARGAPLQSPCLPGAPRRGGVRPRRGEHRAAPHGTRPRRSTRSPRWPTGSE